MDHVDARGFDICRILGKKTNKQKKNEENVSGARSIILFAVNVTNVSNHKWNIQTVQINNDCFDAHYFVGVHDTS